MTSLFRIPRFSWSMAVAVWMRNFTVYGKTYKLNILPNFFEPVFFLLSMGIGVGSYIKEVEGVSYLQYIGPGLLASQAMMGATFEVSYNCFVKMNFGKVYDAIMATPVNVEEVALGEILWAVTRGVLYAWMFFVVLVPFGAVPSAWALAALPATMLIAAMFASIGLAFTAVNPSIDLYSYYFTLFISPMFLFSGIFFPLSRLPEWARVLANVSPLYHCVELVRGIFAARFDLAFAAHLGVITALTAFFFLLAVNLIHRKLIH
jgi:lipooligosaccharide transport system permease protein